jgi:hypothetical protein
MFAAGDVDTSKIRLDDVTVCLQCGTLLVFNPDFSVRPIKDADILRLNLSEESWDLIKQLQQLVEIRNRKAKPAAALRLKRKPVGN